MVYSHHCKVFLVVTVVHDHIGTKIRPKHLAIILNTWLNQTTNSHCSQMSLSCGIFLYFETPSADFKCDLPTFAHVVITVAARGASPQHVIAGSNNLLAQTKYGFQEDSHVQGKWKHSDPGRGPLSCLFSKYLSYMLVRIGHHLSPSVRRPSHLICVKMFKQHSQYYLSPTTTVLLLHFHCPTNRKTTLWKLPRKRKKKSNL